MTGAQTVAILQGMHPLTLLPFLVVGVLLAWVLYYAVKDHFAPKYGPGQCRQCGYDLTGNASGRCPECGKRFRAGTRLPWEL